jgi:hypothetical protein
MDHENKPSAAESQKLEPREITEAPASGVHLPAHGHNPSSQHNVTSNPDLALHYSHEHEHQHLHHHKRSIQGRDDEVVYSRDHLAEKSNVPNQNAEDSHHQAHYLEEKTVGQAGVIQADAEKGAISPAISQEEDDPQSHKVSRFYGKWKIVFHAVFLALMTGYVECLAD